MKMFILLAAIASMSLMCLVTESKSCQDIVFTSDFESGLPVEFSGPSNSVVGVQNFVGLGPEGNTFSGDLLRNSAVPATLTTLTLSGLPEHTSIDVEFLLAIIDSWDGTPPFPGPDFFNVQVDGVSVFSHTFAIQSGVSDYVPPPGGLLSQGSNLGFSGFNDQAFDMYLEPTLHAIPHTANTLSIDWFASGGGWQGETDESWGIDNVRITTHPRRSNLQRLTSTFPSTASPIPGLLQQQIDVVNTGPPTSGYGPVNRHADLHLQSSFDCLAGDGAIDNVSGAFELLSQPPASVLNGALLSNTKIRVFTESTRIATESDAIVDATEPGTYNNITNPPPPEGVLIPAGSLVSSHLLHFDTTSDTQAAMLMGTVTFESDVLGVSFRGERLIFTDDADPVNGPFLGSPTTSYPSNPDRAWEIGANGFFTIGQDRRTVTAQALVQNFLDQIRIITAASPVDILAEPYVSADEFIDDADEVTFDNCSSAWYRFTFELPANFTNASLSGIANVDDVAVAYLNGNRISATVSMDDLGVDRVDEQGRPLLSWPTRDAFGTCDSSHFVAGTNELVFGVVGDLSQFDPTGLEFEASVAFDETTLLGDINQDGVVNLLDVNPFVDLLTSGEFQAEADVNQDGVVSLLDVAPFVQLLVGG